MVSLSYHIYDALPKLVQLNCGAKGNEANQRVLGQQRQ